MGIPESQHEFVFDMTNIILSQVTRIVPGDQNPLEAFLGASCSPGSSMIATGRRKRWRHAHPRLVNAEIDGDVDTRRDPELLRPALRCGNNDRNHQLGPHPSHRESGAEETPAIHMPGVVEIVRHASPVIHFRRTVTQDSVRPATHHEGDKACLWVRQSRRHCFRRPRVGHHPCHEPHRSGAPDRTWPMSPGSPTDHRAVHRSLTQLLDIHAVGEPDRLRSSHHR